MEHVIDALARAYPFAPTNDEPLVRANGQQGFKANTQNSTDIIDHPSRESNALARVAAQLAARGYTLTEVAGGGLLVSRWDRTLHCSDLRGVRAFCARSGVHA